MNHVLRIMPTFDHASLTWCAYAYIGGVCVTQAHGRDQGAAVADVVAKLRTSRALRHLP